VALSGRVTNTEPLQVTSHFGMVRPLLLYRSRPSIMRFLLCRVRDAEFRVVVDLQKVVSAEEYKPEGGSLRSYTRLFLLDGREYLVNHSFDEVHKALQSVESGI
jgi:hypothetical protein